MTRYSDEIRNAHDCGQTGYLEPHDFFTTTTTEKNGSKYEPMLACRKCGKVVHLYGER